MKKLIIAVVAFTVLAGCHPTKKDKDYMDPWTNHGLDIVTKVVEIEGHKYILMDGYRSGGIIHAESCWCKNKR
jgi:hypothetical protein